MNIEFKVLKNIGPVQIVGRIDGKSTEEVFSFSVPAEIEDNLVRTCIRNLYHSKPGISRQLEGMCTEIMLGMERGLDKTLIYVLKGIMEDGVVGPLVQSDIDKLGRFLDLINPRA